MMSSNKELDSLGFTFIWRIENFSYHLEKKDQSIDSPNFVINSDKNAHRIPSLSREPAPCQTAWYLQVYPRGTSDNDLFSYSLRKVAFYGYNCMRVNYQLSIIASDGSLKKTVGDEEGWFHQGATQSKFLHIEQGELFGKMKDLYLPQDTLTLHCRMWDDNKVGSWLGQSFARSRIDVEKRSFIWKIENFSALQLAQDNTFVIEPKLKQQLSLRIYLTTYYQQGEKLTSLQIDISQTDTSQDNLAWFKMALIDSEGCSNFLTIGDHLFKKKEDTQVWCFTTSIMLSKLLENENLYLQNDTLSIRCDCLMSTGVSYSKFENIEFGYTAPHLNYFTPEVHQFRQSTEKFDKHSDSLKTALLNLYNEKTLCDFELRVGSETITVPKTVLGARSPVFCGMLSNDMIEKKSNGVDITDLECDTVKRMLHYMYTDSIEDLQWDEMSKLYFAADKYAIESLKQKCSLFLKSNLSTTNVCEALDIGDLYQDDALKAAAMKFILCNDTVLLSDEWLNLIKHKGQLVAEVTHWLYLKKMDEENTETVVKKQRLV